MFVNTKIRVYLELHNDDGDEFFEKIMNRKGDIR